MSNGVEAASEAKAGILRAKEQMARALANTPDERVAWSPAASARTPAQLVAHAAMAVDGLQNMIDGRPFPDVSHEEFDRMMREADQPYSDRAAANALLEKNCDAYVAWLDAMTPQRLAEVIDVAFGMGKMPVSACLGFAAQHMASHTAQLEYIQTIYGDRTW